MITKAEIEKGLKQKAERNRQTIADLEKENAELNDEVMRLQGLIRQILEIKILLNIQNQKLRADNAKLLRVKEAAEKLFEPEPMDNETWPYRMTKLSSALKALDEK